MVTQVSYKVSQAKAMVFVLFLFSFYKVHKKAIKAILIKILIINLTQNEPDYKLERLDCVADYPILENEVVNFL